MAIGSIFDPDVVFRMDYEAAVAQAIHDNQEAAKQFEGAKADWLANAAILKAIGRPLGLKPVPALAKSVEADFQARTYVWSQGPGMVADPDFDLLPGPEPATGGIALVGPLWMPGVYRVLEGDTFQPGQRHNHNGILLERKHSPAPFTADWYQVVKV